MGADGSITTWIQSLRSGNAQAARELWQRFFDRMKEVARPESRPCLTRGAYDEEDVALSAFAVFCGALRKGNFPELEGRDELWKLLATITLRKARQRAEQARTLKRGAEVQVRSLTTDEDDTLADRTPPPDLLVMMTEECRLLLDLLHDPTLESIAVWKLEGYTDEEIAGRLGYTRRTVVRHLALIRRLWEDGRK